MAFLEMLQEMLTRDQVADLATNIAVISIEREKEGNSRKFLNLNYARNGEVEWVEMNSPGIFAMKGKFLKDIYPKVKGKLGKARFIDRESIRDELGYGSIGAIQSDSPSVGFSRAERGGSAE